MVIKLNLKNKFALVALLGLMLSGCDGDEPVAQVQQPVQQQPQVVYEQAPQQAPVIVNQQPSSGIGSDHLVAGAVGYMLGKSAANNSNNYGGRTVVNKTIVNKTYVNKTPKNYYGNKSAYSKPVSNGNRNSFSSSRSFSSKSVKSRRR